MVKDTLRFSLKDKILKFLIENKESPYSIRELSKELKADYKNTSQALDKLPVEIYSKNKQGNSYLIKFKPTNNIHTLLVEDKRTAEFLTKNPKLKLIKQYVEELDYPFLTVLVFGSFVKQENTKQSDIDICIIHDNRRKAESLIEKFELLSLNLEIQNFTTKEFISMIEKVQNNLGHEIVKNNIILYGKEAYYNLISKWMTKE